MRPFALPDPAVARHPNVLLAPRELKHWIEQLPMGNPPRTAEQLLQQLRLLVRDPSPGNRLTTLLDCYHPTLERLQQVIETRLPADADSALPLDQLELLVLEILSEMASGYLRACNEQLVHGKAPSLSILFRAATLLDDAAVLASLHYHRPPQPNWPLLLHVYLLAEQMELSQQAGSGRSRLKDLSNTIHGVFFAAYFIAICDPHRHSPAQIRRWHEWLRRHTAGLSLLMLPQGNASIPVDISGTLPPLAAARLAKPGADTRYVIADPIRDALAADLDAPAQLRDTLDDLLRGRRSPEQRRTPRQARNHPYKLLFGLYPITQRLLALSDGGGGQPPSALPSRQTNQSSNGASFQITALPQQALAVGEPVLAEAETSARNGASVGFLARIRRVQIAPGEGIELGVEKLPGRIMPITITGSATPRLRGDTAGLLLHQPDNDGFLLIASGRLYREGDVVNVEGPSVRHALRMHSEVGGTQRLAYIKVEVA